MMKAAVDATQAAKPRMNWSTLKHMATSPKLLKWRLDHPQKDTPALRLGRAIHCAILEPHEFDDRWGTQDICAAMTKSGTKCTSLGGLYHEGLWYCGVRGHAPEGAGATPEGMEIISREDRAMALTCAQEVRQHPVAKRTFMGGKAERDLQWMDPETGALCRGRLDYIKAREIVDLKSGREETPREFTRAAALRLYHGQLAWYHDGAIAAGEIPPDADLPLIVHASTSEPYDVAVYRLSKISYMAGQVLYRDLLRKFLDCQAADWWPGMAPYLLEMDLPGWAAGMQGSEESIEGVL